MILSASVGSVVGLLSLEGTDGGFGVALEGVFSLHAENDSKSNAVKISASDFFIF